MAIEVDPTESIGGLQKTFTELQGVLLVVICLCVVYALLLETVQEGAQTHAGDVSIFMGLVMFGRAVIFTPGRSARNFLRLWVATSIGYPLLSIAYHAQLPPGEVAAKYSSLLAASYGSVAVVASLVAGAINSILLIPTLERHWTAFLTVLFNLFLAVQTFYLAGRAAGHFAALNAIAVAVGYGVGGAIRASFETLEETMCGKQVALHAVQAARRKAEHAPTEADCFFAAAEEPWGCEQSDAHDGRVAAETKAAQRTASESTPPETPPETPSIKPPIKPPEERPLPSSLPPQSPSAARSPQQAQPSAPQEMTMHQQQQRRQQLLRQQQQQLQQEQLRQQCWQQQQVQQQQLQQQQQFQQQWQQQQQWEQHWHTQQWQQQNASGYLWVQPAVQPWAQPMHQAAGPHVSLGPYSDAYSHADRDSSSSGSGNGSGRSHPPEAIDGRSSELSDADTDKETRTQKRRRQRLALNARYTSGAHVEAES